MASPCAADTVPSSPHPPHLHALAAEIHHNLLHQHDWASLETHTHSLLSPHCLLPRPLLSGLPPQRIYIHPDTQLQQLMLSTTTATKDNDTGNPPPPLPTDLPPQREWVLPTHIDEKWTLQRFNAVFEALPAGDDGRKRVLLATVGGDSTVVYYILHEGIVKPRQN